MNPLFDKLAMFQIVYLCPLTYDFEFISAVTKSIFTKYTASISLVTLLPKNWTKALSVFCGTLALDQIIQVYFSAPFE